MARNGANYQCLVCSALHKTTFNLRRHFLTAHKWGQESVVQELDEVIEPHYLLQSNSDYSCLLCRKVLKGHSRNAVRLHFVGVHLEA